MAETAAVLGGAPVASANAGMTFRTLPSGLFVPGHKLAVPPKPHLITSMPKPGTALVTQSEPAATCAARAEANAVIRAAISHRLATTPPAELAELKPQQFLRDIEQSLPGFPIDAMEEAALKTVERARAIARKCAGNRKCLVSMSRSEANKAMTEGWFKNMLKKSCMGRNPTSLKNLGFNQLLLITSMTGAYWTERGVLGDKAEFAWSPTVTWVIMGFVWAEINCINEYEKPRTKSQAGFVNGVKHQLKKYVRMLPWIPVQAAMMVGTATVADGIRGREPISWASLYNHFRRDGLYALLYTTIFGSPKGAWINGPLVGKLLPVGSQAAARWGTARLCTAGLPSLASKIASNSVFLGLEGAIRWGVSYGDNLLYLWMRRHLQPRLDRTVEKYLGPELDYPGFTPTDGLTPEAGAAAGGAATRSPASVPLFTTPTGAGASCKVPPKQVIP